MSDTCACGRSDPHAHTAADLTPPGWTYHPPENQERTMTDQPSTEPTIHVDHREEDGFGPVDRLASLPPLTAAELTELHLAVEARRQECEQIVATGGTSIGATLASSAVRVLWSLDTAIEEARMSLAANREGD